MRRDPDPETPRDELADRDSYDIWLARLSIRYRKRKQRKKRWWPIRVHMGGTLAEDTLAGSLPSISSRLDERYFSSERQVTRRIADHRDRARRTANFIISSRPHFFLAVCISPHSQESWETFRLGGSKDRAIYNKWMILSVHLCGEREEKRKGRAKEKLSRLNWLRVNTI